MPTTRSCRSSRAEAVKAYLVSKGIEKNRVYTEGKGEKQPVADNKTAEGRAKNRRVEIEVVGTRANQLIASGERRKKPRSAGLFCLSIARKSLRSHPRRIARMTETRQRRPGRTGQILRARPSLVGSRKRIPAAAPDQPAAAGLDRVAPAAGAASACWTSAAAAASWPMPWRARAPRCWASTWPTKALEVAQLHALEAGTPNVDYREVSAEALAAEQPGTSTSSPAWRCSSTCPTRPRWCAPAPRWSSRAAGCSSPRSTAIPSRSCFAIVGAEYVLQPAAARHARIPASSSGRANWPAHAAPPGWSWCSTRGMEYNPLTRRYWLSGDTSVNYLFATRKALMMFSDIRGGAVRPGRHPDRQRARPGRGRRQDAHRPRPAVASARALPPHGRRRCARHAGRGLRHRRPSIPTTRRCARSSSSTTRTA